MPAQEAKPKQQIAVDPNKFDLRTHTRDGRGRMTGQNTYRLYVRDGNELYERPSNSGNLFYENNQPAGRVELIEDPDTHATHRVFDLKAKHKEYTAPLVGEEKMHFENENLKSENEALRLELAAIKAEEEKRRMASTDKKQSANPLSDATAKPGQTGAAKSEAKDGLEDTLPQKMDAAKRAGEPANANAEQKSDDHAHSNDKK